MEKIALIASVQSSALIAVGIILGLASIASAIGMAILGSKYMESSARQPEMMQPLLTKFFIIGGMLEAVSIISPVIALLIVFGNPLLSALS